MCNVLVDLTFALHVRDGTWAQEVKDPPGKRQTLKKHCELEVRVCYQRHEDEKSLQQVDEVVEDEELPDGLLVEEPRQQETDELGVPVKRRVRTHDRQLIMKSFEPQFLALSSQFLVFTH